MKNILITGGAGFIGSHVVRLFVNKYPQYNIINLDALTYAGNLANLKDVEGMPNYTFIKADICNFEHMCAIMQEQKVDGIIHLAAESHVDRSIKDPFTFARTNIMGTLSLLEAARRYWGGNWADKRFYHISTDIRHDISNKQNIHTIPFLKNKRIYCRFTAAINPLYSLILRRQWCGFHG